MAGFQINNQRKRNWDKIRANHANTRPETRRAAFGGMIVCFARDCPWYIKFFTLVTPAYAGIDPKFAVESACAILYLIEHFISPQNLERFLNHLPAGIFQMEAEGKRLMEKNKRWQSAILTR